MIKSQDGSVVVEPGKGAGKATGTLHVPGSKSVTHRTFILAAQSQIPCTVTGALLGADTHATLAGLHAMGARFRLDDDRVRFEPAPLMPPREAIDCQNSGTSLRLLTGLAARLPAPVTLTGDDSLQQRPNQPLLRALGQLGARVAADADQAPFTIQGPLHAGTTTLPPRTSSQYASSILLAATGVDGVTTLILEPPVSSRPYIDLTLRAMERAGLRVEVDGDRFTVTGPQAPSMAQADVEADWSTAAFPLVAAAITGGTVTLEGLDPDSLQGDRAVVQVLEQAGCDVAWSDGSLTVTGDDLRPLDDVDVAQTPDMFPALAVLASQCPGTTRIRGGGALRHKESDRIAAMAQGLQAMGVPVTEHPEGMDVPSAPLRGAFVASHHDHRIHMAFCVAALAAKGTSTVDDPDCVAVSYPAFHDDLTTLLEGTP